MEPIDPNPKSLFDFTPRKKKKYILFLYTQKQEVQEKIKSLEKIIQTTLKDFILLRLEEPDEGLKALLVKNIELVIIDSSLFDDDATSVEYAMECKRRRRCPVLFIAKDPVKLIEEYREKLFAYEEFDNYFAEPIDSFEFKRKLEQVSSYSSRAAKRFLLGIPVRLFRLNNEKVYNVKLTDISLVGFGIESKYEDIFSLNEQIQIKIPLFWFKIYHDHYGEFLPISGKLRRISISGEILGFSIEHITSLQIEALDQILSAINYKVKLTKFTTKIDKEFIAK